MGWQLCFHRFKIPSNRQVTLCLAICVTLTVVAVVQIEWLDRFGEVNKGGKVSFARKLQYRQVVFDFTTRASQREETPSESLEDVTGLLRHVVQRSTESYVHRVGTVARGPTDGEEVLSSLATEKDDVVTQILYSSSSMTERLKDIVGTDIDSKENGGKHAERRLGDSTVVSTGFIIDEAELIQRVDKLPFKLKEPSRLLLQDISFAPRPVIVQKYDNAIIHQPVSQCQGRSVVIIVPSHPKDWRLRKIIRETWGRAARGHKWPGKPLLMSMKLVFVLGVSEASQNGSNLTTEEDNSKHSFQGDGISFEDSSTRDPAQVKLGSPVGISDEEKVFDDIVQFNMVDSYANLTRKILLSLKWVLSSCGDVGYIFKIDQDIFPNIPLLLAFLTNNVEPSDAAVYGTIYSGGPVERNGRWGVPADALPIQWYPTYASGTAYILTQKAAQVILHLSSYFPYVPVEDAFITGVLASAGSVQRFNVAGFTHWAEPRPDDVLCDMVMDKRYFANQMTEFYIRQTWEELRRWEFTQEC